MRWRNSFVEFMTTVGRAAVLDPDYVATALKAGTPPADVAEANRFVYAVLKSTLVGTPAANRGEGRPFQRKPGMVQRSAIIRTDGTCSL